MKFLTLITLSGAAALFSITGASAATSSLSPGGSARFSTTTFSLTVAGTPSKGTTFWVAHGPLGGRFGVIRLRAHGNHTYSAKVTLPAGGVTSFTYLAAEGTQIVHGTPQPGGAVMVIRSINSVTAKVAAARVVRWSVPLG